MPNGAGYGAPINDSKLDHALVKKGQSDTPTATLGANVPTVKLVVVILMIVLCLVTLINFSLVRWIMFNNSLEKLEEFYARGYSQRI